MMVRTVRSRWMFVLLAASLGVTGLAFTPAGAEQPGWPPDPSQVRYPEEVSLPDDPASQHALLQGQAGIRDFLSRRPAWSGTVDPYTGSVDRMFGDGIALEGPASVAAGRAFIVRHRALFATGLEGNGLSLVFNEKASRPLADPAVRFLQFDLQKDGIPVLGAGLGLGVNSEKVVLISSSALGPVTTSSKPKLTGSGALEPVRRYLAQTGPALVSLVVSRQPALAFYPLLEKKGPTTGLRYHLVWILEMRPEGAPVYGAYIAYVDAHDGDVLAFFPEARTTGTCSADPAQATASVIGGVRANRADDPETVLPLPLAKVDVDGTLVPADRNGRFPYTGGSASSTLRGEFFNAHCDSCTSPPNPAATADESGDIDFGSGGASAPPPVAGNGVSTPADRTAFYHLQQARFLLGKWDNAFFDEVDTFVNIASTCNAFSSSYMLGFFAGGGNCRNTGEIRDVMQHELGHTWDRTDGTGITSGGMSEWKGDLMAIAIGGDSCIGESFRITGGPTTACSGVRDVDEKAPGRADHPLTPAECSTCATLTRTANNCSNGVHCIGEISGQSTIHLLNNLTTGTDYISGAALPAGNPALGAERARWLLERLLVAGGPPMQTWNPTFAGVSVYDAMMLIDDDDANLANGTPHAAYINSAFGHHGIAETPQVIDSANCTPLSDPLATAVVDRDPATGLPLVRIQWTPVGGAMNFDVYRNARAGDAFLPIARDVSAGPILDTGVQVGATYRYFVAAVRKTGCAEISPGGGIVTATVTTPELKVLSAAVTEVAGASDGDGMLEPGERVSIHVTLQEIGGFSPATGVTATLTSSSPASPITSAGPVAFGTVPAGGSVIAPADFETFVGPSEVCGGRVHLILSASGNEGCWLDGFDIQLSAPGCAVSSSAFVEVVPGSVQVISSGGDGDGIPDNCEAATASYQIRNSGMAPSGPASATVSTTHAGVTFAPTPVCSVANLNGGDSSLCQFTFSLGDATETGVPFTLTAGSAASPASSNLKVTLGAETDPPAFGLQPYGFEGSLEGWAGQQFSLSSSRASLGTQSAHSGSTTAANICGKLTSPPFLLSPSATSTLSLQVFADIEPLTDQWYDRANVHVVDLDTGQHLLMVPSSGVAYLASGNPEGGLCHIAGESGWASNLGGFNPATFDLTSFAGHRVRIEINYASDDGDDREGVYIDEVSVTNAAPATLPSDLQSDACLVPEVSAPAAPFSLMVESRPGDTFRFTWQDLGPGFQYNLYAGALGFFYSHGAGAQRCSGLGTGMSCDGATCTFDEAASSLPAGDLYFVMTATAFGVEGTSGFASSGTERNPAENTCLP